MKFLDGIEENLRFMVLEVTRQVENTLACLENPDPALIAKIESRDDYIDNLKSVIENVCYSKIHGPNGAYKPAVDMARAVNIVSSNLERVADHAVNIVMQVQYLSDPDFIKRYDYLAGFHEVDKALGIIVKALLSQDIPLAFKICRAEFNLDAIFKDNFDRILIDLRKGESPENCITSHNIFRYLERMGDSILNIGEAIIFAAVGEKFKIHQYQALKDTLAQRGAEVPISKGEFQSIWGTRSGCRIGKVPDKPGSTSHGVLFKEGNARKIIQERDNIERWEKILPGLPPRVQGFQSEGDSASMLLEYLGGCTLQQVVLSAEEDIAGNAVFLAEQTMGLLWEKTRKPGPVSAGFIRQLHARLEDVFRLHAEFDTPPRTLGDLEIWSFAELLEATAEIERQLPAPFSVFIHGDCNINNIIYDHVEQRIHFIDLYRSKDTDYVQDVSVFLVSNYRLPIMDQDMRQRPNQVIAHFLGFAREFARAHGDDTFEARLALGVIRSFLTSTRFEFNREFAKDMFLRGVYLMNRILAHAGTPWREFRLPDRVLHY
ncbi:PhoU domain-containing protein [Desulfolutivibrio sulfoxidireducens]|uniref:PhoU domain-containing protein n=1 Tax=Desulfolutivibrio sulfoxidireducens TaxID=2773299 RepID=UPI00159D1204|nr:PhoU domain-containing protein [Desulfolutivibrio sulfoxidireducens]QLA17670.1 phosphotransferase [Desulfolutivibrio sulfoxidireducens]QLA21239.1 phosphotransferase [Desulfolutivibrio sulfoxidireducens]